MHPSRIGHALPWELWGMKLTLPVDASATMQAKVISRSFEREPLPWKRLFLAHFEVAGGPRAVHSARRTQDARGYVSSFRKVPIRALGSTTHVPPSSPRWQEHISGLCSDDLPSHELLFRVGEWQAHPTLETGRLMEPNLVLGILWHRLKPAPIIPWDSARP